MNWFYESAGQQQGPVSEAELDRLVAEGRVLPTTLVWREGMAGWQPLQQARPGGPAEASPAAAGTTQCDSCGRWFDPADVIELGGRKICAGCKPAVLQGMQQGSGLPNFADPARTGPAWEHRAELGFWPAVFQTIKAVLTEPSQTFSTMRTSGGIADPFWFYMLAGSLGQVVATIELRGLRTVVPALDPAHNDPAMAQFSPYELPLFGQIIMYLIIFAIGIFINAGVLHVCLMICGGARRSFEATFRALCYGSGSVGVLMAIPIVGFVLAIPWSIVVSCISLSRTHETDLWRVILALLLPMIICCVLALVAAVIVGMAVAAAKGH